MNTFTVAATQYRVGAASGTLEHAGKRPASSLSRWLRSPSAERYDGQWVFLADDFTVVDFDLSPTVLAARTKNEAGAIVFVAWSPQPHAR